MSFGGRKCVIVTGENESARPRIFAVRVRSDLVLYLLPPEVAVMEDLPIGNIDPLDPRGSWNRDHA
jgi:hypothetical protein